MATDQVAAGLLFTIDILSVGSARFPHIVASKATIANW